MSIILVGIHIIGEDYFRLINIVFFSSKNEQTHSKMKIENISRLFNSFVNDAENGMFYFKIFHCIRDSFLLQAFGGKGALIEEVSAELHSG